MPMRISYFSPSKGFSCSKENFGLLVVLELILSLFKVQTQRLNFPKAHEFDLQLLFMNLVDFIIP